MSLVSRLCRKLAAVLARGADHPLIGHRRDDGGGAAGLEFAGEIAEVLEIVLRALLGEKVVPVGVHDDPSSGSGGRLFLAGIIRAFPPAAPSAHAPDQALILLCLLGAIGFSGWMAWFAFAAVPLKVNPQEPGFRHPPRPRPQGRGAGDGGGRRRFPALAVRAARPPRRHGSQHQGRQLRSRRWRDAVGPAAEAHRRRRDPDRDRVGRRADLPPTARRSSMPMPTSVTTRAG